MSRDDRDGANRRGGRKERKLGSRLGRTFQALRAVRSLRLFHEASIGAITRFQTTTRQEPPGKLCNALPGANSDSWCFQVAGNLLSWTALQGPFQLVILPRSTRSRFKLQANRSRISSRPSSNPVPQASPRFSSPLACFKLDDPLTATTFHGRAVSNKNPFQPWPTTAAVSLSPSRA
jgi:hypothetical protein